MRLNASFMDSPTSIPCLPDRGFCLSPGADSTGRWLGLPATCGELVQGTLDGVPCLVSCPIDLYNQAEVSLQAEPGRRAPAGKLKAAEALRAGLEYLGSEWPGAALRLRSPIPLSRGYASSTADIGAALFAVAQELEKPLDPWTAAQIAIQIEPTDSTFFSGLALLSHREVRFFELLGPAPGLHLLMLDPGGEVDTLRFNRQDHRDGLARLAPDHREAFELLQSGLERASLADIAQAATLSARAHQAILFNPLLEQVLPLLAGLGALGVCRAHSGTLVGILFDPRQADLVAIYNFLRARLPARIQINIQRLVDGGPRLIQ